jgi:hypothetical protein
MCQPQLDALDTKLVQPCSVGTSISTNNTKPYSRDSSGIPWILLGFETQEIPSTYTWHKYARKRNYPKGSKNESLDCPEHRTRASPQRDERLFKDYWDKEGCCGGKGVGESEGSKCKLDSDVAVARQVLEECAGEKAEPGAGGGEEGELRRWVEGWMTGELLFSRLSLQEGMSVLLAVADGKGSDELLR